MKISVITVAYNSARTIGATMQSVNCQTHQDVEHIVIDGGSSDATVSIVKSQGRHVAQLVSERDRGIYDAMNKGISMATGDVVGFLNSDDVYAAPETLALIAQTMTDPVIDACYGDLVYVDATDNDRVVRYWKSQPYRSGLCAKGWMPAHPTFYARREVYQRFGGFDIDLKLQADFEMALRLLDIGHIRTRYVPALMVRMSIGGASNSTWRNVVRGNLEAARACRKHGLPGGPTFIARKLASRIPQFFIRPAIDD
jgi:glycosyltransferase involved in cell wall biosynthesis